MECDTITNQFSQMNVSSNDIDMPEQQVHLEKPTTNFHRRQNDNNFSDQRLNVVKQRLMARQAEHNSKAIITKAKLISLDEAIRLCNEERKQREVKLSREIFVLNKHVHKNNLLLRLFRFSICKMISTE